MADHTGQQLGNYRLMRHLGHGGFAEVYLGEHVYLKSYAALKVLHTILKEEDVEGFLSEAQTLVALRHPNIVRVLEFIFEQGTPVLVMDYAPGGTARQRFPNGSRLPLATTVAYVKQVANALQYAHNHNIIHRDVKPDNILFDTDQQILLSDFGLALFAPSPELLSTHEWAGTIPYISPEQFQRKPTFASDQYALGIITYEWLCGMRPFGGEPWAIINQHLFQAPPPLREKRPDLPAAVEQVVLRALAKDPQQRFTSMQAFAVALTRASQQNAANLDDDTQPLAALKIISPPASSTDSTLTRYRPQAPRRIFLTAAPADEPFAQRLRADLEARGVVVSRASEDSTLDQQDQDALRHAVRDAHVILVVVSPFTRSSHTIKEQLRIAGMYQQRMVFVRAAGDDLAEVLPEAWGRTAMIDLVDARGARYIAALDEVMAFLQERSPAATPDEATLPVPPGELRNPFKGLRAFTKDDAADFFGRDALIVELAETIEGILAAEKAARPGSRLLSVIGPSGSGKSSVVMAGLLPGLQNNALPGSEAWVYLPPIVPGEHPLESLALACAPHLPNRSLRSIREDLEDDSARGLHLLATQLIKQPGAKVVLTIDQFEELFAQAISERDRQRFIDLLVTAATEPRGPLIILLTLRADFYDRPMHYPQLSSLIEAHQTSVRPMNPHELRAIIERPAVLPDVQVIFEDNLVGDLLFETQGQIGALPLLEFTLDQLFRLREGRFLTSEAYRQIGGVKGALAKHAESTYASLPSQQHRQLARSLFLRLIDPEITEQDTTRRRAPLSELSLPDPQQTALLREVADAFIAARLLTTNENAGITTIEVSHEALIREWARLAGWLREAREDIILQQGISADAMEWVRRGRPEDRLYRGAQLVEAQLWAERNVPNTYEVAFLQDGVRARGQREQVELNQKTRELNLQRRVVSRQRLLVTALSIFSVIVIVFASLVIVSRQQAIEQRNFAELQTQISRSRALAANASSSLAQFKLDRALLLSVKANQTYDTYEARDSLLSALEQSPHIITMLRSGSTLPLLDLVFSSNSHTLVSSDGSSVYTWNTETRQGGPLHLPTQDYLGAIALSPDGHILATSSAAGVRLWDFRTGTQLASLEGIMNSLPPGLEPRTAIAFSLDGKRVAYGRCQYSPAPNSACVQTPILVRDVQSKQLIGPPRVIQAGVNSVAFSPDGTILASGSDTSVQLWSVATGQLLNSPLANNVGSNSVAFSPDGTILASGSLDGTVRLWDMASGLPVGVSLMGHTNAITSVAFSPDGTILASGSLDGTVRLWDMASKKPIATLTGDPQQKISIAFTGDGKTLASGSSDGTIILWNIPAHSAIGQQLASTGGLRSPIFSADGSMLFTGSEDGKILLRNAKTGEPIEMFDTATAGYPLLEPKEKVSPNLNLLSIESLALSGDGEILAAGRLDGTIILWNMKTKKAIQQFGKPNLLFKITLSSNGQILAASSDEDTITLWDTTKGKLLHTLPYHIDKHFNRLPIALSPDGKLLAVGGCDKMDTSGGCVQGQVQLWDVTSGNRIGHAFVGHSFTIAAVAFSPDGKTLASSSHDGLLLWNTTTGKPNAPMLSISADKTDYYNNIVFSPDGKTLASVSGPDARQSSFVLWDLAQNQPLTHPISQGDAVSGSIAFSPNGEQLASVPALMSPPYNSILILWNVGTRWWEKLACTIANRPLTNNEWKQFVSYEPFDPICPIKS